MTAPSFERPLALDDLVRQAEALNADERLPFLQRACADNEALLSQAMDRLRRSSPQWWDHSIDSRAFDPSDASRRQSGESIGAYRIVRPLGEGGMGEVVLAERDDGQFRQQVAIKLVKRGALSRNVQGRLKAERQILASLDHPNIARLLDGGTTVDGTPYIVMEYIEGESIDKYCDSRKLPIEARLSIFRIVCAAVHSAHQNLIVHRDLKPSNILVTGDGTPKLLDFGIAKILDERQFIHTLAVTQLDVRVMTPEHASPEQIRGEQLTTASDTYALGVLLYELLTGHKPYEIASARLSDIERAICEQAPLPLTASLPHRSQDTDSQTEKACAARSTTVAKLRRTLSGDLATIVMTALRKEPERRYASVEQFAADIERYLSGMPVAACKDSWQYRTTKFVQRHRVAVASSTLAFVGLAAFAITTTLQAQRITRETARAAQVSSFLIDMFQQADPTHSRGRDITVREMLDVGSRRMATQLAEQPDTRAHLQAAIGKVYADLGLYDAAEPLLRESIAIRSQLYGARNKETATSLQYLGDTFLNKKDLEQAAPLLEEALAVNRRAFGPGDLELAASLRSVGELRVQQQRLADAEQLLGESMRVLAEAKPSDIAEKIAVAAESAATLNAQAILSRQKGDYAAAESIYRQALATSEKTLGRDHPTVAFLTHNLAIAIERQGRLAEAQPIFKETIELYRKIFGAEHPETLTAMANYGASLHRMRDLPGAERIYREVLQLREKLLGDRSSPVGYDHVNLGMLLHDKSQFRDAEIEFRTALDIYDKTLPANHSYKASAYRSLALTLIALNKSREAETDLRRALDIFGANLADDNPQMIATRGALGKALAAQKRFAEAEPLLLQSYRSMLKSRGASNSIVTRMHTWIEELYRDWNKSARAAEFFASLQTPAEATAADEAK